ncbi:hypothetical protein [Bifidobacterium choloepi]|uniref:TcdA-E operon negative regulator n=1 Tax=Bifidobacterium choloepi TaxID=2614131 RepID=A0A6I5N053_9BIFI|nr:hypothetical protein [Bifidobacterium choloepi]NEG69927.1 hypothetical protein [Bifidobacterium choloepi]
MTQNNVAPQGSPQGDGDWNQEPLNNDNYYVMNENAGVPQEPFNMQGQSDYGQSQGSLNGMPPANPYGNVTPPVGNEPKRNPLKVVGEVVTKQLPLQVWHLIAIIVAVALVAVGVTTVVNREPVEGFAVAGAQESFEPEAPATGEETDEEEEEVVAEPQLVSITVSYAGTTEAGATIDTDTDGIAVRAQYDDGTSKQVYDFKVVTPVTLEEGKTSEVTVSYEGCTAKFTVTVPMSEATFKSKVTGATYDDLARNPDSHTGEIVHFRGEIKQVIEGDSETQYRIGVSQSSSGRWTSDDVIYVSFATDSNARFLEDDVVEFWGYSAGLVSYTSTLGSKITIPSVLAKYMELVE